MFPLALALLMVGAAPPAAAGLSPASPPAVQAQQSASGLIIAEDVAGRVAVYDITQRIVFEMDKESGRPVRVGVAPGTYEVRFDTRRSAVRVTVQVRDGEYAVVDSSRFAQPSAGHSQSAAQGPPPASEASSRKGPAGDAVHRIEGRFAAYPTPSFSREALPLDLYTRSSKLGVAFEYVHFLARDVALGFSAFSLVRSEAAWTDSDHNNFADEDKDHTNISKSTTYLFGVVRWNFARRLTESRTVEPYVTGGVGPVIRWNQRIVENSGQERVHEWQRTTGFGGRAGAGVDVHLGRIFTLGVVGAWNWSTSPNEDVGYGSGDRGGEVGATMGFNWGWPKQAKRK
jgi:hypothetical protein